MARITVDKCRYAVLPKGEKMSLSERERQLLEEMERSFYKDEADTVSTTGVAPRLNLRTLVLGVLVFIIGLCVLVGSVAMGQLWLGVVAFAVMVGGILLAISKTETGDAAAVGAGAGRAAGGSGGASAGTGSRAAGDSKSRRSMTERFEERWDRRMDGEL